MSIFSICIWYPQQNNDTDTYTRVVPVHLCATLHFVSFKWICGKGCNVWSSNFQNQIALIDFIPSSFLATPCGMSSIMAFFWSAPPEKEVHLSSSTNHSKGNSNGSNFILSSYAVERKKIQFIGAGRFTTCRQNEYFLIYLLGMAPGPRTMLMDDVLMLLNVIFTEQGKL